jgi:GDP-mannose 6-dehydrogenase
MKISVLGLGYVGAVSAACLARDGHEVIGVDPERAKVDLINAGKSPIIEKDIGAIIAEQVAAGRLRATTGLPEAVRHTDMSLVCVGTPSLPNGGIDLKYVRRVCEEIGRTLATHEGAPVIVMRSTMLPGTMREAVIPTLEKFSGKRAGEEFGVCINPEFLREGTAVYDYDHPPKTVIGEVSRASGDLLASVYARMPGPMIRTDIETAEMVKYADNAWHALKVGFANEIGNVCKGVGVDAHKVMEIFCQDQKLNLSPYYLKPGFAFGGSCLPKDLRALGHAGRALNLDLPLLDAVLPSNQRHLERVLARISSHAVKRIGVIGLSFKPGTDDVRESAMVAAIERLIGRGCEVRVFDPLVDPEAMVGANRAFALAHLPHIARLVLPALEPVIEHAELLLIGHLGAAEAGTIAARAGTRPIIDCARTDFGLGALVGYEGICW